MREGGRSQPTSKKTLFMTVKDIIEHRYSAVDFYAKLQGTSIAEASQEPLKIGDLVEWQSNQQQLRSGKIITFGEALCFLCIDNLCSLYKRKNPLSDGEKEYLMGEMVAKYSHWSVADLPTFVKMCTGCRLPSTKLGETEYELIVLDIPSILGKLEVYDRMRPNKEALQGNSPERDGERPWEEWREHCLIDGTPHEFRNTEEAKRYWRAKPDMNDERDRSFVEGVIAKLKSAEFCPRGY